MLLPKPLAALTAPAALLLGALAVLAAGPSGRPNQGGDPEPPPRKAAARAPLPADLKVLVAGQGLRTLRQILSPRATALVFVGTLCPIANGYAPELAALGRSVRARGGQLALVYSNPGEAGEAPAHARAYGLSGFPVILDEDQRLADLLRAKITPEAFVLDGRRLVRYSGRIDDRYIARGKPTGSAARVRDLEAAMTAVLAGKPVACASRDPFGCFIERSRRINPSAPTYAREVAPILNRACVPCHRPGEIGPMPFTSYAEARKYAANIASVAARRYMPPWKPVPGHGDFEGARRLSEAEVSILVNWGAGGAPAGDVTFAPPPPAFADGWALGEPDLVLSLPEEFEVPAAGPDLYRCFVLPTGLTEDREVVAVEYRPGNKRVVHHVIGFLDATGAGRQMDEKAEGPGYTSFGGPGFLPTGELGGWAPGLTAQRLPEGIARPLRAGTDLVLQVHYHPAGKPEKDRTRVGIYFARTKAAKLLRILPLAAFRLDIPPGEPRYETRQSMVLPFDSHGIFVVPHMHLLGKTIQVEAALPDGAKRSLIRIDDWDFNWQDLYTFKSPVALPKGTTLTLTATYDNSAENRRQPRPVPERVTWGEGTTDEMCVAFVGFTADDESDPLVRMMDLFLRGRGPQAGSGRLREGIARFFRASAP